MANAVNIIDNRESEMIRILRVLSMFSIVVCHIMQPIGALEGDIFNVGVEVFFLISGFLYGHKVIADSMRFYSLRVKKIYIPFLVFFVSVLPFYYIIGDFTWFKTLKYLLCLQGIGSIYSGLGHLWFITFILFCYLITPLLQRFRKYSPVIIGTMIVVYLFLLGNGLKIGAAKESVYGTLMHYYDSFSLYIFGYFLASLKEKQEHELEVLVAVFMIAILAAFSWSNMDIAAYNRGFHTVCGIFVFMLSIFICRRRPENSLFLTSRGG